MLWHQIKEWQSGHQKLYYQARKLRRDLLIKNSGSSVSVMLMAALFHQRRPRASWNASRLYDLLTMVRFKEPQATAPNIDRFTGGFYDFTADLASKDTAYTSLALQAHTDTTYFSDPAGLQMFHLLSHSDGFGGESLLVDGFAAAKILQKEAPDSYDVLSQIKIRSHASGNDGISIQPFTVYPVFNQDSDNGLYQIRWNSSDRATMDNWHSDELLEKWYEAAWKWCEILRRPEVEYWEQLRPGRPLSMFYPNSQ